MSENKIFEGIIMIRGKGVGYIAVAGFDEDVVIAPEETGVALDSDIVEIELLG